MLSWFSSSYARRYVLPILLFLVSALVLGCYFETNDDYYIVFLLRGVGLIHPVTDLHLYLHGIAAGLAHLYQVLPDLPWYGILLYGLLLAAIILLFGVLDRATSTWPVWLRVALLVLFFVAGCLENVLRMNFTRVPILLAGATILFGLQRLQYHKGRDWWWLAGGILLLLAWAIRPSGAFLGLIVVAPALFWLAPHRRGIVLLLFYAGILTGASAWQMLHRTEAQQQYQRIDVLKANYKDYGLYRMQAHTHRDSVGLESLDVWWGLGDTTLVNNNFFKRTATVSAAYSFGTILPSKTKSFFGRLAGDYFLIAFLALGLLWALWRQPHSLRQNWWGYLYALYMGALIVVLGLALQLPPRLATPMLGLFLVVLALYSLPRITVWPFLSRIQGRAALVILVFLLGGYVVKTMRRAYRHHQEQERFEQYLALVNQYVGTRPLIQASVEVHSLSPFKNYDLGHGPVLVLNGWTAHDPSQLAILRRLTGTDQYAAAMQQLTTRPDVVWLAPQGFTSFFTRYLATIQVTPPTFCPAGPTLPVVNEEQPLSVLSTICPTPKPTR
jgi:hypothetical protein